MHRAGIYWDTELTELGDEVDVGRMLEEGHINTPSSLVQAKVEDDAIC